MRFILAGVNNKVESGASIKQARRRLMKDDALFLIVLRKRPLRDTLAKGEHKKSELWHVFCYDTVRKTTTRKEEVLSRLDDKTVSALFQNRHLIDVRSEHTSNCRASAFCRGESPSLVARQQVRKVTGNSICSDDCVKGSFFPNLLTALLRGQNGIFPLPSFFCDEFNWFSWKTPRRLVRQLSRFSWKIYEYGLNGRRSAAPAVPQVLPLHIWQDWRL